MKPARPATRRACAVGTTLALLALLGLTEAGCSGATMETVRREFMPGQAADDAGLHAYQAAMFVHGFSNASLDEWRKRLDDVEASVPPFMEALAKGSQRYEGAVESTAGPFGEAVLDVHFALTSTKPRATRIELPSDPATAADPVAMRELVEGFPVPVETLQRGHLAVLRLVFLSGTFATIDDAMRRYAFRLIVLRQVLRDDPTSRDPAAPLRPHEFAIADIEYALAIVADFHAQVARLRSDALALLAIVQARDRAPTHAKAGARAAALTAQIAESRAVAARWQSTATMPRPDSYGLAFKPVRLPTPDNLLAVLDRDGYVTAAIGVANGLVHRDLASVVESLGKLAPPNSAVRVTSRGLASALRGDIEGTVDAVVELSGDADLAGTVGRLREVGHDAQRLVSRMAPVIAPLRQ